MPGDRAAYEYAMNAGHNAAWDKEWTAAMSNYYKFRHEGSDVGMTEFIKAALQKPLPPKP